MKVGDLVQLRQKKTQPPQVPRIATIVEVWRSGRTGVLTTIDVMWTANGGSGAIGSYSPRLFEVVSEV